MPSSARSSSGPQAGLVELRDVIGREFVITVELDPPKGPDITSISRQVEELRGMVAAVNIADSPMARMRMSPIALASIIKTRFQTDTIFHLTCRDRNILGLQSELLGAWAMGVKNILALTGDPPSMGDHPGATGVYDVDAVGLAKLAGTLNEGFDLAGNRLNGRTDFLIGVAVNPIAGDMKKEMDRFRRKIESGASFAQTQPIYDPSALGAFLEETASLDIPCLAGVLPIKSHRMLHYLDEKVPGIVIPEKIRRRILKTPPDRVRGESVVIAAEIIKGLENKVAGAHIMPVGDYSMVPDILALL